MVFDYNLVIEKYFKDKLWLVNIHSKYNFSFLVWNDAIFSDWTDSYINTVFSIRSHIYQVVTELGAIRLSKKHQLIAGFLSNKRIKRKLFCINYCTMFTNKLLYTFLHCHFFAYGRWSIKMARAFKRRANKNISRGLKAKKKLSQKLILNTKKPSWLQHSGILSITFTKRNMFLNLSSYKNKNLLVTSLRKLGFSGRRRKEYASIYSATTTIKQLLRKYKIKRLAVVYKGWNRFRLAVRKALRRRDTFRIPIVYVKFSIKVPHNGCRINKRKRKKRKKKVWLKRKLRTKKY
jgi:ribosomal protein S11